jgi:hypothetical protein
VARSTSRCGKGTFSQARGASEPLVHVSVIPERASSAVMPARCCTCLLLCNSTLMYRTLDVTIAMGYPSKRKTASDVLTTPHHLEA